MLLAFCKHSLSSNEYKNFEENLFAFSSSLILLYVSDVFTNSMYSSYCISNKKAPILSWASTPNQASSANKFLCSIILKVEDRIIIFILYIQEILFKKRSVSRRSPNEKQISTQILHKIQFKYWED